MNKPIGVAGAPAFGLGGTTDASGQNESDSVEGTTETDSEPVSARTDGGCTVRYKPGGGLQSPLLLMAVAFVALTLTRALKRKV